GQLRFNPRGPNLSAKEWRAVLQTVKEELVRARTLVLSGGLPRGVPVDAYAKLLHLAHEAKIPVFLDCDGLALKAAVKAKPFLVKPNVHELADWWGKPLASLAQIKTAARALSDTTGGWVLVSRGSQGALLLHSAEQRELM